VARRKKKQWSEAELIHQLMLHANSNTRDGDEHRPPGALDALQRRKQNRCRQRQRRRLEHPQSKVPVLDVGCKTR
jgi:hypothetical protein